MENWHEAESHTKALKQEELEDKQQQRKHEDKREEQRNELFKMLLNSILAMFFVGYLLIFGAVASDKPSPYSLAAATVAVMVPLVLSLAMARFLFGNKKDGNEKNIPSLMLTFFAELRKIIGDYFKFKKEG